MERILHQKKLDDYTNRPKQIKDFIGNTPLIALQQFPNLYVKLEGYNPFGSIKARVAAAMVDAAEATGKLIPFSGQTIIEASGGSTGWALCGLAHLRGYKFLCVLPDNYSQERMEKLRIFGAEVRLSDHRTGNDSHFKLAHKLEAENLDYYYIDQLSNPVNPEVHYRTTAEEIVQALPRVDYFICGVGSGGSISGIGKKLKEVNPECKVIAVQPAGCDILQGVAIPHKIQGWAVGPVPSTFDTRIVDEVLDITYEAALDECQCSMKTDAIYVGISGGANIAACKSYMQNLEETSTVLTLAPDAGHNYLNENFLKYFK